MSLNPRLVAIQGIEFTPIQIAIQGLLEELQQQPFIGGGSAPGKRKARQAAEDEWARNYVRNLNAMAEEEQRRREEEEAIIMSVVQFVLEEA